ncbi:hypothetical protein PC129_g1025 [Phytophthora cactorum]|uniref:F-box domain-containing protein n=1 Tax=Phytophthora cactorum TaxID=29920 RepID=A0A329SLI4_9STRA|nr:hypothetical protein Pcac1_g19133 [Phytophthora cactorum]KAG2839920.1 hypothetical protein PC112_g3928 [Phytophthora cactorum]KAG2841588.1 hypothetical protein PC111_g3047 [Phytophthora cactorum]KAG2867630.1 hypothetical protein PC113_g1786 [Phytophthora cactorum]KAG2923657.1 hypothetical protein PC114_g4734 [Phytophthora cactorum]
MNSEQQQQEATPAEAAVIPSNEPASITAVRHTRRCNGRDVCSCMLRVESAYFQKNLAGKAAAKKRRGGIAVVPVASKSRTHAYQKVTNIQQLSYELKLYIAAFLAPISLGRLGMTNKTFKRDVEIMAKQATRKFLAEAPLGNLLKQEKPKEMESWSQFMHNQMTCVHKLFVYYTGYKTGPMRQQFPLWSFGIVHVDPLEPHRIILPNTWTFNGHNPWIRRRGNGKDGEWLLMKKYAANKAPKDFLDHVKTWANSIRPGSVLAIAYQNAGSMEPAWWEAQAWYVWRGDGKQYPAIVYDPETETRIQVHPDDLLEHFRAHPLHVIDVSTEPGSLCRRCASQNRTFKYCHLDKGHPML